MLLDLPNRKITQKFLIPDAYTGFRAPRSDCSFSGDGKLLVAALGDGTIRWYRARDNAELMARQGAAVHLPQAELTPARLAELLKGFTRESLRAMAEQARTLARPQAAARVADQIEALVPPHVVEKAVA